MPLVFVHGVNVRYDPSDDPYVNARTAMFRDFVLPRLSSAHRTTSIFNPYWGNRAAKFPWNHGALPTGSYEAFGEGDDSELTAELLAIPGVEDVPTDSIVVSAARRESLDVAVDALWTIAASGLNPTAAAEWSASAATVAVYAEANPRPDWLARARDDDEFVTLLFEHATAAAATDLDAGESESDVETFGRMDNAARAIKRAAARVAATAAAAVSSARTAKRRVVDAALLRVRTPVHKTLITFLGDMLAYFHERQDTKKDISDVILADFDRAAAESAASGEPLVVVGHSMGGIIMYDLLTSIRSNVAVDALVTVGSQIAVIEEQKLFTSSEASVPNNSQPKVRRPRNIKRWINVFDTRDILGFPAGAVFNDVEDYMFETGRLWAHGGYLVEPMFHQRLAARL
jgi:hypothetical protein